MNNIHFFHRSTQGRSTGNTEFATVIPDKSVQPTQKVPYTACCFSVANPWYWWRVLHPDMKARYVSLFDHGVDESGAWSSSDMSFRRNWQTLTLWASKWGAPSSCMGCLLRLGSVTLRVLPLARTMKGDKESYKTTVSQPFPTQITHLRNDLVSGATAPGSLKITWAERSRESIPFSPIPAHQKTKQEKKRPQHTRSSLISLFQPLFLFHSRVYFGNDLVYNHTVSCDRVTIHS